MVGCGRPRDGTEVVVLDSDGGELPAGHLGEIAVRGPAVTSGYHAGRTGAVQSARKEHSQATAGCHRARSGCGGIG